MKPVSTWDVTASTPPPFAKDKSKARLFRRNINACVVATNARRVIELMEKAHPGVEVHSLQRRGELTIIDSISTEEEA